MKILLMTRGLSGLGGTETWTRTMAKHLGGDVSAWAYQTGIAMPCPVATELVHGSSYDLILINHNTSLAQANFWKLQGTKVFTSHGPLHPLERYHGGADHLVCVSEEVAQVEAERQTCEGCGHVNIPHCGAIIRQPIDLELFQPKTKKRNILVMPKHTEALEAAAAACEGMDYDIAHYRINPIENIWDIMPDYRVVITAGRGAVEAMACGCQVLIYNGAGRFDGWATEENVHVLSQVNYSGRRFAVTSQVSDLRAALQDIPEENLRPWVEEHHDARKIARQYLAYAGA